MITLGKGFCSEMNKHLSSHVTTRYTNLTNTELIDMIYNQLKAGMPVPIELAALYNTAEESVWTLHYALVTAMDIHSDTIEVYNPYGYIESYTVEELLDAARYDSYENMEFYFKIAFALGIFDKNSIHIIH